MCTSGLICQQCGEANGRLCDNSEDNGQSVECNDEVKACMFRENKYDDGFVTTRRDCADSDVIVDDCYHGQIENGETVICFCTTDNCNKENECYC